MNRLTRTGLAVIILLIVGLSSFSLLNNNLLSANGKSVMGVDNREGNSFKQGKNSQQLTSPSYDLREAPELSSFFKKYDQSYLHPDSYLPERNSQMMDKDSLYYGGSYLTANIDLSKIAYLPGEEVEYSIQVTNNLAPKSHYPIRIVILKGDSYYHWYYDLEDVEIFAIVYGETNNNGFYKGSFLPDSEGSFTILVIPYTESDYPIARRVVTISSLGVFWRVPFSVVRNTKMFSYALVTNITDFSPVENATVTMTFEEWSYLEENGYNYSSQLLFSGKTNNEGLVILEYTIPNTFFDYGYLNLLVEYNGTTTEMNHYLWFWDRYASSELYNFITTTDKPIYQPGETINTRTIVFEKDYWKVSKEPLPFTDVEVEFKNPAGFSLFYDILTTDGYGVISWDFKLDPDVSVGEYYLSFSKDGSQDSIAVEVDIYEKPDFRVEIDLESEYVPPGEEVKGTVTAEYYFGKPVPGGEVKIEIFYFDDIIETISGSLDSKGKFTFSWKVPRPNLLFNEEPIEGVTLRVTVTDPIGRVVQEEVEVTCTSELWAYIWTNPYSVFQKGDEIIAYFGAYQIEIRPGDYLYHWSPVSNASATIDIFGLKSKNQWVQLFSIKSSTDLYGRGCESFTIPEEFFADYKIFIVEVTIETNDGRSGTADRTLLLAVIEANIEITPSEGISPGDEILLTITVNNTETGELEKANMGIYVMDSEYDTLYNVWDYEIDGVETFTIHLSDYAPDGKYFINTYCRIYDYYNDYYFPSFFSGTQHFVVGTDYSLSIETDKDCYNSADQITITGHLNYVGNSPTIVELTKRGIVEIITINSSQTDFIITIDDISDLGPKLTIFAHSITPTGRIMEAFAIVEIVHEINVEIETDKSTYEPGQTAKITISVTNEAGEPIDALGAFSLIDSSIFGVKEDSLSEETFFAEEYYWSQVSTSSSWTAPMAYWWYWWMVDLAYDARNGGNLPPSPTYQDTLEAGAKGGEVEFEGEIRDNLPESANWIPELEITNGKVEITLALPDNIGEWTVRVFITSQGLGVVAKETFKTFLPFFVDLKLPQGAVQDDVIIIRGIAYNYLSEASNVSLTLAVEGLTIINDPNQFVNIPRDYLVEIRWSIYCNDFGLHNATLTGIASIGTDNWFDGIRRPLVIQPNGVSLETIHSGFLNNSETIYYDLYEEHLYTDINLVISPGLMDVAITSWERLIGYPYGCIEQTMSKILPDVMIYHYLEENGQLTESIATALEDMLQSGLSRIAAFQHSDGGWGWWSDDGSQTYMTALVLYGLGLMKEFGLQLSPSALQEGIDFLISKQLASGAFTTDNWRVDDLSFTAYVIRALLVNSLTTSDQHEALSKAVNYFISSWDGSSLKNPYAAALFIEGTIGTTYEELSFINTLIDFILSEAIVEQGALRWEISETTWRALGGAVETTATVISALSDVDFLTHFVTIRQGLTWLIDQQSNWGWGNTADTSAAISAITKVAKYSSEPIDCTVEIKIGDWTTQITYIENETNYLAAEWLSLEDYLEIGPNSIIINQTGSGQIYYFFSAEQILRSDPQVSIDSPIYANPGEEFFVEIMLEPKSTVVYPINIILESLEDEIILIGDSIQTIQFLDNPKVVRFYYQAPTKTGEYTVGGFSLQYTFADITLENQAPGIVSKILTEVPLIVQEEIATSLQSKRLQPNTYVSYQEQMISQNNNYDITISREYSKIVDFIKGDTISVTITIDNQWENKEFIMIEDFLPAGFEVDQSSLRTSSSITDYDLSANEITLFLLDLPVGITTISYRITAMDVGSSVALPTKLSSMYDFWQVESEPIVLGTMNVNVDPATGTVRTDSIKPVLISEEAEIDESESYSELTIKVIASDNDDISTVKILYSEDGIWKTKEATLTRTFDDGRKKFFAELGQFIDGEVSYLIVIEDQMGNAFYSGIYTVIIPAIIIPIVGIVILIIISAIVATTGSMATIMMKPKKDAKEVIENTRETAFIETEEDLRAYKLLKEYKD